jgi:transcriptional regulator with XRE-family HTH domain
MRRNDPNCRGHRHPKLKRPVSRDQVQDELEQLYRRAGYDGPLELEWPEDLGRTHDRNHRRYAQVAPFMRPPAFELAPQAVYLPARNRRALLAHEVGHVLAPHGSEDDADRAAFEATGVRVGYDDRWPGKGLQVALNPDERRRAAERRAQSSGGHVAEAQALVERLRAGEVTREQVELQARAGDEVALQALGIRRGDLQVLSAVGRTKRGKLRKVTGRNGQDAVWAWHLANGWAEDRHGALRKGDRRIKFKARVYEVYKGKPGAWFKASSHSYIQVAEKLAAEAQQRLEGGGAVERLHVKQAKRETQRETQRSRSHLKGMALRLAAIQEATRLGPEGRRQIVLSREFHDGFWDHVLRRSRAVQVPPEAQEEDLDRLLSVFAPPIPGLYIVRDGKREAKVPREYTWVDRELGLPITVKRHRGSPAVEIQIGSLWVDPLSGAVTKAGMLRAVSEDRTGLSGAVKVMETDRHRFVGGILYMIISTSPRKGVGTNMVRTWCRLMKGYGVSTWVARAVGDQGAAFLNELEARGEIRVTSRLPNRDWVVQCTGALDDPRQMRMFGNPIPYLEPDWSRAAAQSPKAWAYMTLDLIRESRHPSSFIREAQAHGAHPVARMNIEWFGDQMTRQAKRAGKKPPGLSGKQKAWERWKATARDYGLERLDAYSVDYQKREGWFTLDVRGAYDAAWAVLGPPHPLEAAWAPVGGPRVGESREFMLLDRGPQTPQAEAATRPEDWEHELERHSAFWMDMKVPKEGPLGLDVRHYAIEPEVRARLKATADYRDPDLLEPILTPEERAAAMSEGWGTFTLTPEEDVEEVYTKRKKAKAVAKGQRRAAEDVVAKLEELEAKLGRDEVARRLRTSKIAVGRIRNKSMALSADKEQKIHNLYGEVFGGPVPKVKQPRKKKAPKPRIMLKRLVEEIGEKETAARLMRLSGAKVSNVNVSAKVAQIRTWLGTPFKRGPKAGKKRKVRRISTQVLAPLTKLYDQVITQVYVPEAPEDWKPVLSFILDRISQSELARALKTSPGTVNAWAHDKYPPTIPVQDKLVVIAEEVKHLPRDPRKGLAPGKTKFAPFQAPGDTPEDVVAALRLIYDRIKGKKQVSEATGVSYDTWRQWALGKKKKGRSTGPSGPYWGRLLSLAHSLDPSFKIPPPHVLEERVRLREALKVIAERVGRERVGEFVGVPPEVIDGVLTSSELPPRDLAERIFATSQKKFTYAMTGRVSALKGKKRKISDVVGGWRPMLLDLYEHYGRNAEALRRGLKTKGYGMGTNLMRSILKGGPGAVAHKGQRAIAALHEELGLAA